ncbi:MAG: aldo/keto reductase [Pseudomonadota bacterium]
MAPNRRSVLAGAGSGLLAALAPMASATTPTRSEIRTIPSSGAAIPAVGLGSWITFNVGDDPVLLESSAEVIAAFIDEGGGMIDSSPMYGSAQKTIGRALQALPGRGDVFSADKVWTSSVAGGPEQIADTGANWGLASFDLLQVHNLVSWEGHLDTLLGMKADGQLRYVGITTSHGRRHDELERIMRALPIDFVQLTYNLVDRDAEERLLPLAMDRGIAVIVNRPFRRGALTGRLANEPLPGLAADLGAATWAQLILKFILSHPAVTVAIPATTRVDHLRENKASARGPMPDPALRQAILDHFYTL